MILNRELLNDAIGKKRPIQKLFNSVTETLFEDYVVGDYVTADKIPETELGGSRVKVSAPSFFEEHKHLMRFNIDDILRTFDDEFVQHYHAQEKFPFEYTIHFFDTFIVAEIMPRSLKTEFLLVSPRNQGYTKFAKGVNEHIEGMTAFTVVTTLCLTISREAGMQLALYMNFDELLEYLRTGLGKKKWFGII